MSMERLRLVLEAGGFTVRTGRTRQAKLTGGVVEEEYIVGSMPGTAIIRITSREGIVRVSAICYAGSKDDAKRMAEEIEESSRAIVEVDGDRVSLSIAGGFEEAEELVKNIMRLIQS